MNNQRKKGSEVAQSCLTLRPHGLQPTRLLRPWDSPGMNTGVCCHFLLQGIFPTQGSNPGLPHSRHTLYHLSHYNQHEIYYRGILYPFFLLILIFCNQMCILHIGHFSVWTASQVPKSHTQLMAAAVLDRTDVGSHCSSLVWHCFCTRVFSSQECSSLGTSLVVQWRRLHTLNAGGPGSIPGQGTRSHRLQLRVCMLQLRIMHAATKT